MRRLAVLSVVVPLAIALGSTPGAAQPAPATIRVALLPAWVTAQHHLGSIAGPAAPELRAALDSGVVEGPVFAWDRGRIARWMLVPKPIRVLDGPEAAALGGRGRFELVAVRPPEGASAWNTVQVTPRTAQPDDVLVLEIGGDIQSVHQVLTALAVATPEGVREIGLAPRALITTDGVPVVTAVYGRPLGGRALPAPRGAAGVEFLVARSGVDALRNASVDASGFTNVSYARAGEWREGDRLFARVPLATLQAGAPGIVVVWKTRTYLPDGGDTNPEGRRSTSGAEGIRSGPRR
jgi:hypothetical protein